MKEIYKDLKLRVLFYEDVDVIAASKEDAADDFGGWNDAWFTQQQD